jgi:16S rRNA processing protein RimM
MSDDRFMKLARVGKAHGVRGEVKLHLLGDADLRSLRALRDETGRTYPITITSQGDVLIAKLGLADRNAAELLQGTVLGLTRAELPETDAVYASDLIGVRVCADGQQIGMIRAIENYGAGDIVVIETPEGELMLPYAAQFFPGEPEDGTLACILPEVIKGIE